MRWEDLRVGDVYLSDDRDHRPWLLIYRDDVETVWVDTSFTKVGNPFECSFPTWLCNMVVRDGELLEEEFVEEEHDAIF